MISNVPITATVSGFDIGRGGETVLTVVLGVDGEFDEKSTAVISGPYGGVRGEASGISDNALEKFALAILQHLHDKREAKR